MTNADANLEVQIGWKPSHFRPRTLSRRNVTIVVIISVVLAIAVSAAIGWQMHENSLNNKWKRASDAFGHANYNQAEKEIATLPVPTSPQRLHVYAQTMLATQHLDKSLVAYQRLYAINKDPAVQLIIGNIYNQQKHYDQATKIYQQAITDNPANVQGYVNLATLYKSQGNTAAAITTANQAITNNPGSNILHELQVSMLMDNTASPDYAAAIASLRQVSPNDPLLSAIGQQNAVPASAAPEAQPPAPAATDLTQPAPQN